MISANHAGESASDTLLSREFSIRSPLVIQEVTDRSELILIRKVQVQRLKD